MLTLTRRGKFIVVTAKNDRHQCGIRGTRKLFYRVELTCPSTILDKNGFMVDQLDIDAMIQKRYSKMDKFMSCELLAIDCANAVRKMVKVARRVKVTIGSGKLAFMTAEIA